MEYVEQGIESLAIDFQHRDILRLEKLETIKRQSKGGGQQEGMFPEEFTDEMEREIEELQDRNPKCSPKGEKLIRALERFRLENKRKFEEHGLHTLFIALGNVRWKQPLAGKRGSKNKDDEFDYESPLILLPVSLETKKRPEKHTQLNLDTSQYDPKFNPVLSLMLEREYETESLELPEEPEQLLEQLDSILKKVEKAFKGVDIECEIEDGVWLRMFSFHGQQIYEDLCGNEEAMLGHEFINALCEGEALPKPSNANLGEGLDAIDVCLQKENDFTVLDADSSQLEVIHRVKSGNHLVVTGPPGTGKSQTIANNISSLVSEGKTVLLVCEKQAALKVVYNRLREVGLERICLPLYDHKSDKKIFAKNVVLSYRDTVNMKNERGEQETMDAVLNGRSQRIKELSDYAKALLEVQKPLNRTVYWVHGELSKHQSESNKTLEWQPEDVSTLTYEEYVANCNLLIQLAEVLHVHHYKLGHPWRSVERTAFTPDFVDRVYLALKQYQEIVRSIASIANKLESQPEWAQIDSIATLRQIFDYPELFESKQLSGFLKNGISSETIQSFLNKCENLSNSIAEYQKCIAESEKIFAIPEYWNQEAGNNYPQIKPDIKLEDLHIWHETSTELPDVLDMITKCAFEITDTTKIRLSHQSYQECIDFAEILSHVNILKQIENWHNLPTMKQIQEELSEVNSLIKEIGQREDLLQKYGVMEEDIPKIQLQEIEQRFRATYKTWLRSFSSNYRQDCATVISYCSLEAPKKHKDIKELAIALSELERSKKYLQKRITAFSKKNLNKTIKRSDVEQLLSAVSAVITVLSEKNLTEMPLEFQKLIEKCRKKSLLVEIAPLFKLLENMVSVSQGIVSYPQNAIEQSLEENINLLMESDKQAKDIIALQTNINSIIENGKPPSTVQELITDANKVARLYQLKQSIDKLNFKDEFGEAVPCSRIILDEPETILKFQDYAELLIKVFPSIEQKIETRQFQDVINELKNLSSTVIKSLSKLDKVQQTIQGLFESEEGMSILDSCSFDEVQKITEGMINNKEQLEEWTRYKRSVEQIRESNIDGILDEVDEQYIQSEELVSCYAKTLWNAWLEKLYRADNVLKSFDPKQHNKYIKDFKAFEENALKYNARRVLQECKPHMKQAMDSMPREAQKLLCESQKKRHPPIRKALSYTAPLVQQLKPCWLMSPLTLSSFLPYGQLQFDVVIFDEASQIRVEHAFGAIARSKQVVVIGDPNQLPPTSFFDSSIEEEEEAKQDELGETIGERAGYESLIQAATTVLPHGDMLLMYHYRSKYEKLIAFSNHFIYDSRLVTFPAPVTKDNSVEFVYVEDGVYDSGGTRRNDIEATKVATMCVEHVKEYGNGKSLGVIALSKAQEVAIRDALATQLKMHPEVADILDENSTELHGFFIKNLESVQGDERNTIILSVGYGKDKNGNVFNRFGPINHTGGHRRLNVAVTRSSEKMYCVSSIHSVDISPSQHNKGAIMLQKYLEYAENGVSALEANIIRNGGSADGEEESMFETEVKRALQAHGYTVESQHGVSGYRIDLVIVHPDNPNTYVLAVECDGATYHSTKSARDRDRLRQDILERLGWTVYRVWSQHWIWAKDEIVQDIVKNVESLRHKKG